MSGSRAFLAVALCGLGLLAAAPASASAPQASSSQSSEVSYFFFGIRLRSTSSGSGSGSRSRRHKPSARELAGAPYTCPSCERDEHGRMKPLSQSKSDFLRETGYPYGRTGYVIDYAVPLRCGGADAPANMRWLPVAQAQAGEARCQ
jgi:hypothetical protein